MTQQDIDNVNDMDNDNENENERTRTTCGEQDNLSGKGRPKWPKYVVQC